MALLIRDSYKKLFVYFIAPQTSYKVQHLAIVAREEESQAKKIRGIYEIIKCRSY